MKLEDKFLEKINEYFINEKPQWLVKAAHDLAEIKLKADKDKIVIALTKALFDEKLFYICNTNFEASSTNFDGIGAVNKEVEALATAILDSLEVEK